MTNKITYNAPTTVTIQPPSSDQTLSWAIRTALGGGGSDIVNWAIHEIPRHLEEIDRQSSTFLETLIDLLANVMTEWEEKRTLNLELLGQIQKELGTFQTMSQPALMLYPQIMEARSYATDPEIQKKAVTDIHRKQLEATTKACQFVNKNVKPLYLFLDSYVTFDCQSKILVQDVLDQLEQFRKQLTGIAREQRSPLAKVAHMAISSAKRYWKEGWKNLTAAKKEESSLCCHPLIQLLHVIGRYQSQAIYLPCDKKRDILQAVQELDIQSLPFRGVYQKVLQMYTKGDLPLEKIYNEITKTIITQFENNKTFFAIVGQVGRSLRDELVAQLHLDARKRKELEFRHAELKLHQSLQEMDGQWNFSGNRDQKKEKAIKDAQDNFNDAINKLDGDLKTKEQKLLDDPKWAGLETEPAQWGERFVREEIKELAMNHEMIWRAGALCWQKKEWGQLSGAMQKQEEQKEPKKLLEALQTAMEYAYLLGSVEKLLTQKEKEQSKEIFIKYTVDWIGFAKELLLDKESDAFKKSEIEKSFNEILLNIRKGEILQGLDKTQHIVRESAYWRELWKNEPSPLLKLSTSLEEFYQADPPPHPPKCASEVQSLLNMEGQEWTTDVLAKANEIKKEKVLQRALAYGCFEFVAYFLGLNNDKTDLYKKCVTAFDKIQSLKNRSKEGIAPILNEYVGALDDATINGFLKSIGSDAGKKLYLELIHLLIKTKGKNYSMSAWAAWAFCNMVYDLMELFIRPFSKQLFDEIDRFFKATTGSLKETHLIPIQGLTKALSTYLLAKDSHQWQRALDHQHSQSTQGQCLNGTNDDLSLLLNNANYYEGLTPQQITKKVGYALVGKIRLPNYTEGIIDRIKDLKAFAWSPRSSHRYLNLSIFAGQWVMVAPACLGLYGTYYIIKAATSCINFLVQKSGNWYVWKTNPIAILLNEMLNSALPSIQNVPILDTLLLEQLEELLKNLDEKSSSSPSKSEAGDESNKNVILDALDVLFRVLEIDKYTNLSTLQARSDQRVLSSINMTVYNELKKLIADALVKTSKSFFQKESFEAFLFELLKLAEEGFSGGKKVVLTQEQKQSLAISKGKSIEELTDDDIEHEGKRIAAEKIAKIPKVLSEIRTKAINPAINNKIDAVAETPSQKLFRLTSWMQRRLLHSNEKGTSNNIIVTLEGKLDKYQQKEQDKKKVMREIHAEWSRFIQEYAELQKQLDDSPSSNTPELNQVLVHSFVKPIQEMNWAITCFVKNTNNETYKSCQTSLQALKNLQLQLAPKIRKIEEAEKKDVLQGQQGLKGVIKAGVEKALERVLGTVKTATCGGVEYQLDKKVDELRKTLTNSHLIKHIALWQLRLFLNPELAVKA